MKNVQFKIFKNSDELKFKYAVIKIPEYQE